MTSTPTAGVGKQADGLYHASIRDEWKGRSAGGSVNHPTMAMNPQFLLEMAGAGEVSVTIVLTQSKPEGEEFQIGFVVSDKGGKRLEERYNRNVVATPGAFTNAASVSCSVLLPVKPHGYTILPSTFMPEQETAFTLSISAAVPVTLSRLPDPASELDCLVHSVVLNGQWVGQSAGGAGSNPTAKFCPQYFLNVPNRATKCHIKLRQIQRAPGDQLYFIGFHVLDRKGERMEVLYKSDQVANSMPYINSLEVNCTVLLEPRAYPYTIFVSTFHPGEETSYTLMVLSDHTVQLREAEAKPAEGPKHVVRRKSFAQVSRASLYFVPPPEGVVALVFTDVQGSTTIWENEPKLMKESLLLHNEVIRSAVQRHSGYEVKTEGDAFMVAFGDVLDAVRCCLDVQLRLLTVEWPAQILQQPDCRVEYNEKNEIMYRGLRVRMGIHYAECDAELDPVTGRMDYFGRAVNKAARVSGAACGGQLIVSSAVWASISSRLPEVWNPIVTILGSVRLKGIVEAEPLVGLTPTGLSSRIFPMLQSVVPNQTDETEDHPLLSPASRPPTKEGSLTPSASTTSLEVPKLSPGLSGVSGSAGSAPAGKTPPSANGPARREPGVLKPLPLDIVSTLANADGTAAGDGRSPPRKSSPRENSIAARQSLLGIRAGEPSPSPPVSSGSGSKFPEVNRTSAGSSPRSPPTALPSSTDEPPKRSESIHRELIDPGDIRRISPAEGRRISPAERGDRRRTPRLSAVPMQSPVAEEQTPTTLTSSMEGSGETLNAKTLESSGSDQGDKRYASVRINGRPLSQSSDSDGSELGEDPSPHPHMRSLRNTKFVRSLGSLTTLEEESKEASLSSGRSSGVKQVGLRNRRTMGADDDEVPDMSATSPNLTSMTLDATDPNAKPRTMARSRSLKDLLPPAPTSTLDTLLAGAADSPVHAAQTDDHQSDEAIRIKLSKGGTFLKTNARGRFESRHVYCVLSEKKLWWRLPEEQLPQPENCINFRDITSIVRGYTSRAARRRSGLRDMMALTLMAGDHMLELECQSEPEREEWFTAFVALMRWQGVHEPSATESAASTANSSTASNSVGLRRSLVADSPSSGTRPPLPPSSRSTADERAPSDAVRGLRSKYSHHRSHSEDLRDADKTT